MNTLHLQMNKQKGVMLLEALIAILIFSMGILAIVGLQAASIRMSGDAKYRTDANMLINKIVGQMWVSDRTPAQLQTNFSTANAASSVTYSNWLQDVYQMLPGVSGVVANQPSISVIAVSGTSVTSSLVTVTVFWNLPGEPQASRHSASVVTQIR